MDSSLDLREGAQEDGGLTLELFVEGERFACASVSGDALIEMQTLLGIDRGGLRKQMEGSLTERLERDLERATLTVPVRTSSAASPNPAERLVSRYVYDVPERIETGVCWYDVASDVVGPSTAPSLVRHRMRLAARTLTRKSPGVLRVLFDILESAAS